MQVHRFHETVAINIGQKTQYLSYEYTQELSKALSKVAAEIRQGVSFVDSTVGTWTEEKIVPSP